MKKAYILITLALLTMSVVADARCVIGLRGKHVFVDGDCAIWGLTPCVDLPKAVDARSDVIETKVCKDGQGLCLINTETKCDQVGRPAQSKTGKTLCQIKMASKMDYQELKHKQRTLK
jgi:hypothetical protein